MKEKVVKVISSKLKCILLRKMKSFEQMIVGMFAAGNNLDKQSLSKKNFG